MIVFKKEETLDSILKVFTTTKDKLETFLSNKQEEKKELEEILVEVNKDLDKGQATLSKLTEILE